jgi:di/tricarboxylate transporter
MFRQRVTDIRLEAGDVLLIQGRPEDVQALRANRDVILVEWTQETLPNYFHARRAAMIFAAVVLVAATDLLPIVVAAVAGATAMLLTDCLTARQAARAIDRTVVMTVAATLALGAALQETGGANFLAAELLNAVAGAGPGWVLSALFLLIALLTNVLSNNASAVLFTPIAVILATQLGVDPMPFVYTVIFAASCSFASPIGYQTNLLVMAPGHYRFADYVRSGAPLLVILWLCFTLFAPWYYGLPMTAP